MMIVNFTDEQNEFSCSSPQSIFNFKRSIPVELGSTEDLPICYLNSRIYPHRPIIVWILQVISIKPHPNHLSHIW